MNPLNSFNSSTFHVASPIGWHFHSSRCNGWITTNELMYYCYLFSSTTCWLENDCCTHFHSHQKINLFNFGNNMALPPAPPKYGTHMQADQIPSLPLSVRSTVSLSSSCSLTSVCVLLLKAAWSSAFFVWWLSPELPGNRSRVLAYCCQSGRDACWQRREGSPLSCPALIKGPDPGVDRLATGLQAQWLCLHVCVSVNGSSWSRIQRF